MNRKLQVFVSSTYLDLKDERQAAVEAILEAGHIPAGMELFAASDQSQWHTITNWIDDSDVYMLILGGRYGSIEPESGKSYIEKEYVYALESGKPLFALVISPEALKAKMLANPDIVVKEEDNPHLLKQFREETVRKRLCPAFNDLNHLKAETFKALGRLDRDGKLSGWVKGSDVIDPKPLLDEVVRLRADNLQLHQQVEHMKAMLAEVEGPSQRKSIAEKLSTEAKRLLKAAATSDGMIMFIQYSGGTAVQAGMYNFVDPNTPREAARWVGVLKELVRNDLVDHKRLGDRDSYEVNANGFTLADEIEEFNESGSGDPA